MDKRDLLDRLAANGDERLLLGRVWDKYEQCRRRNIPVVTGFLSPAEQELVRRLSDGYPEPQQPCAAHPAAGRTYRSVP